MTAASTDPGCAHRFHADTDLPHTAVLARHGYPCHDHRRPVALAGDIGHDQRMRGRTQEMWWGIALEAPDPHRLASFYAQLLDWPLVDDQPNHAIVKPPQDSIYMMFQRVPDFVPPTWPGTPDQQRMTMHLDIEVEDLDAAVASAVTLGARVAEFQPNDNVRVLLDPAGHPFCFCRDDQ